MKRGPPPVPTNLKILRGNPGMRPINLNEPKPELATDVPDPPVFIMGYAAEEWRIVAVELHRLGLLTKIDVAPLAAYCQAYGQWRMASELLARMAENDPLMKGMVIKTKYKGAVQNPLVSIARRHAADMMRYAGEFGLTPVARTRIASERAGQNPQSKFGELLAG